jgi:hypothetical protein
MAHPSDCAHQIVFEILQDAKSRRGLRQTWESIDEEIQKEIEIAWRQIVENHLTKCAKS